MSAEERKIKEYKSRRYSVGIYVGFLLFYLIYFHIILQSGFSADDMWNSNVWTYRYDGMDSAWSIVKNQFVMWLHMGRFFPVSNLATFVYVVCPTLVSYKLAIVLSVYLDNLMCALCVQKITGERTTGLLFMLLFPVLIQLTPEYDSGLYCYHMLIQSVVFFCFLSLYMLLLYMETGKRRYGVISGIGYLLALGTYEVGFTFIVILILVAWYQEAEKIQTSQAEENQTTDAARGNKKKLLKAIGTYTLPVNIAFVLMGIANVLVRMFLKTATYDGISVELDVEKVIVTLLKQCSTCVPFGRYLCVGIRKILPYYDVYPYGIGNFMSKLTILDVGIVLLFFGGLWGCMKWWKEKEAVSCNGEKCERGQARYYFLSVLGFLLWILPGGLVAISGKYQQLLGWCSGHLPAYMQSFGFTLMVLGISMLCYRKISGQRTGFVFVAICGILSGVIIVVSQVTAREAVEFMNGFRKYPQDNIAAAADIGFFDEFENQDNMILTGMTSYIYDISSSRQFYTKYIRKNVYAIPRQDFIGMMTEDNSSIPHWESHVSDVNGEASLITYDLTGLDQTYYGVFNLADQKSGALILGRCVEVEFDADTGEAQHVWVENPRVYIRFNGKRLAGVESDDWEKLEEYGEAEIYQLEGWYDIWQKKEYYSAEYGMGVLYTMYLKGE